MFEMKHIAPVVIALLYWQNREAPDPDWLLGKLLLQTLRCESRWAGGK